MITYRAQGGGKMNLQSSQGGTWLTLPSVTLIQIDRLKAAGAQWSEKRKGWYFFDPVDEATVASLLGDQPPKPKPEVEPPKPKPQQPPSLKPNPALAAQLRKTAEAMERQIEAKLNPAISDQRVTARRARIADGMAQEGRAMHRVQGILYGLVDGHEAGTLDPLLSKIRHKSQVELFIYWKEWPDRDYDWHKEAVAKFTGLGVTETDYDRARTTLLALDNAPKPDPTALKIKELERKLLGRKIPGFFATPADLAEQIVFKAGPYPGRWLEPSGGKGNIAEVVRKLCPEAVLRVIEWNPDLREILNLKGFEVEEVRDFLDFNEGGWDRIVMNPPFENFQDCNHVRHAYDLLAPGGRLVSVMCESTFYSPKRKAVEFRDWLSGIGWDEKLPADSFKESGTGVATRLVVIDKR